MFCYLLLYFAYRYSNNNGNDDYYYGDCDDYEAISRMHVFNNSLELLLFCKVENCSQ